MIEHPKTTSVSQPGSKKKGLFRVHISFWGGKSIPHICPYALQNRNFPTKQPLIPRLTRKKRLAGLSSYLTSGCRSILHVLLYIVKKRKQKFDVDKQSLRPLPFLSGEENVLHAFLCYIDRLEVCGERADKECFYKKDHM